jgi:hypothetical protein
VAIVLFICNKKAVPNLPATLPKVPVKTVHNPLANQTVPHLPVKSNRGRTKHHNITVICVVCNALSTTKK